MPKLVRFLLLHSAFGAIFGWMVAFCIVWFNIAGFGDRFAQSHDKPIVLLILALSFGVTFGFASVSTAVMLLPSGKDEFDRL